MPLQPNDLTAPEGDLEASLFKGIDSLGIYLDKWIKRAEAKATGEDAQAAYAYHLAYAWKARQAASQYAQKDVSGVASISYTDTQRQTWQDLAGYWLSEFERLTDDTPERDEFKPVVSRR